MAARSPWREARATLDGTPRRVDGETIVRRERGAFADTPLTVAEEEARSERVRRSKEALSRISSTGWDADAMFLIGTRDPEDGTTVRCDGNPTRASSRRLAGGVSAYLDKRDDEEGCDDGMLYGAQMELRANDSTIETLYQPGFVEFLRRSGAVVHRHAWVNASRRCRTNWHYDNYENVLIVLAGSKRVEVRSPYMDALGGGDCKSMSGFYASGTEASNHGIEGLDGAAFPREFELNVGDALYIPSGWAHRVESEPFTVAVSHWWKRDDGVGGSRVDGSIDARKKRLREWVNDSSTSERRIRRRSSLMKDSYPFRKEFEHQLDVTEFFDDPLRKHLMDDEVERDVFDDILNADDDCVLERVVWAPPRRVLEAFFPSDEARKGNWKKTCSSAKYGYEDVPRNFTTLVNLARERAVALGDYSLAHRVDVGFQSIVHAVDDAVAVHRADSCILTKDNPWPSAYEWFLGTNLDDWHRWNDARRNIPPNASHYFPRSTRPIPADFVGAVATNARYAIAYRASRIVSAHLDSGFDVTIVARDAPNVHERDSS